ncbi:hypothetical protein D9M71_115370 [compost metagenome]
MAWLSQRREQFEHVSPTEHRVAETTEDVDREVFEDRQQVLPLEHPAHRGQRGIFQARRQRHVVGIPKQSLGDDQIDVGTIDEHLRLTLDAGREQLVVITKKFDVLAPRLLQASLQVTHQPQGSRVTHITYARPLLNQRSHDVFDFLAATVIANDDLQIAVALAHSRVQGTTEKARIEGGNDQADKRE